MFRLMKMESRDKARDFALLFGAGYRLVNADLGQVSMKYFILFSILLSGCATVRCPDAIVVDIKPNAPSEVSLRCLTDTSPRFVATADNPIRFEIVCPAGVPQGTEIGGIPCVSE